MCDAIGSQSTSWRPRKTKIERNIEQLIHQMEPVCLLTAIFDIRYCK